MCFLPDIPCVFVVVVLLSQDRVLINRLDSLCTLVLSGQWPTGRRYMSEAQLPAAAAAGSGASDELAADELSFARLMRKANSAPGGAEGDDGGFTVKLLKVSGVWSGCGCGQDPSCSYENWPNIHYSGVYYAKCETFPPCKY